MHKFDMNSAFRLRAPGRWTAFAPLCLSLLVAAAFLIRLWGMSKMHFWDEDVYLLNAQYIFNGHAGYLEIDSRPPLLPLLFAGAFHVWNSDYAAEIVTAMFNALGPLFMVLAGRRIVGQSAAAIVALLLAFAPFFVGVCPDGSGGFVPNCNGHSLLTDCPALTLTLLSLWLGLRALEKQTALRFLGFGFSLAMVVLMRFGSLSTVGILSLLALAPRGRVKASIAGAIGFALAGLPHQAQLPPFSLGFVSLIGLVVVAPVASLMAPYGARFAHRLSRRRLEVAFGCFLLLVSLRFVISLI